MKSIADYGILHWKGDNIDLQAFVDVDWAGDPKLKRPTNGYILKIGNSLVFWNMKRQAIVTLSLVETEYCALMEGTKEVD